MNPYQHLGEEREEESARSWAQPQGCDGMGWARLGWTGHTMLALGSPGTRQCQLAADLLLAGVTQLGLSSTQQQGHFFPPVSCWRPLCPCVVWEGFLAFPAHLRMRPVSRGNS